MVDAEAQPFVIDDRTSFIKGETGHYSILSNDGTYCDHPGAVPCKYCQQYFTDPDHTSSNLHLKNQQIYFAWLHSQLHPHDDGHEPQDAKVLGFMGAINGVIVNEENIPNWLIVEDDGTMGCKVCTCPVTTIADHEQENDHFQAQLLYDMEIYFSQLKLEQEAKSEEGNKENCEEGVSPKRKSDEVDDDGFVLVENKRKRTKRLKVKAGQR
jgi:hypothetical protein